MKTHPHKENSKGGGDWWWLTSHNYGGVVCECNCGCRSSFVWRIGDVAIHCSWWFQISSCSLDMCFSFLHLLCCFCICYRFLLLFFKYVVGSDDLCGTYIPSQPKRKIIDYSFLPWLKKSKLTEPFQFGLVFGSYKPFNWSPNLY